MTDIDFRMPESIKAFAANLKLLDLSSLQACVYFLCDFGEVVYVGSSISLPGRVGSHKHDKEFDSAFYLVIPNPEYRLVVETAFIRLLRPKYNTAHVNEALTEDDKAILRVIPMAALKEQELADERQHANARALEAMIREEEAS